ncbi:unnamed protein product [Rhodiola kirilowii]
MDQEDATNYDEISMQQSLIFSDSLKDLKNLRAQLYSAAEYFEDSYTNGGQKQLVIDTLKDYAVKALVNTVDHLGSVTTKVNELVDSKVEEVSESEIMVSCIEQRLRTCQSYSVHQGVSQQTLVIQTPKYHKRYLLPAGHKTYGANHTVSSPREHTLVEKGDRLQPRNAIRATMTIPSVSLTSKQAYTGPLNVGQGKQPKVFSVSKTMPKNESEKRNLSPQRYPLARSGSLYTRPSTPNPVRPSLSKTTSEQKRYPSEPRKSVVTMPMHLLRDGANHSGKDLERHTSKSKKLLKSLLSRRKSKKDDSLNTYLDEY